MGPAHAADLSLNPPHTCDLYPVPMTARHRPVAAAARPVLAAVAGGLALVVGALTAASTRLLLHGCVEAHGALGVVGLRLNVLRRAAECPDGTLGAGPTSTSAVLLLSIALPVLLAYVALGLGGFGALAVVARVGAVLRHLVRRVVVRLPRVHVISRPLPFPAHLVARPVGRVLVEGIARRGPPVAA